MAEKKNIMTYEGLKKIEEELQYLKVEKRQDIAQKLKEARAQGDLSENAEYDAAKDEQRDIEARIDELEKILKNAEVVDEDEIDLDKINVGCQVKILDMEFNEELEALATAKECYFLDTYSLFVTESGYLPRDLSTDGLHLNQDAYDIMFEYIKTHTVQN